MKPGKRIRSRMCILSGRMAGYRGEKLEILASCLELIHLSTLIHDDVIDNATSGRGIETHNKRWDNSTAVLYGDFVLTSAMKLGLTLRISKSSTSCRK
ncbi:MAG: polyprenyl synthetase family protein [Marinilabiliales bacterium]|nr:polyprenyl synthetase family protein [Marinilabiliales bacterium]